MLQRPVIVPSRADHLRLADPERPVHFFAPAIMDARLKAFQAGFGGLVTYAVKANPTEPVLTQLWAGAIGGFDVASPDEIALVARLCPGAAMHYNNPVRSRADIAVGIVAGVRSWSVDDAVEFAKLVACGVPQDNEVAVRFRLPVKGAAYDFGAKFGASEDAAPALLAQVAQAGYRPALTFHVGTQCADPAAFSAHVRAAARIAAAAGVQIKRLNVGGGFPCAREKAGRWT